MTDYYNTDLSVQTSDRRKLLDIVQAKGHQNVLSTHKTTLEVTTEDFLTKRGNCIISINSNKSVNDFSPKLKHEIQAGHKIRVKLQAGDVTDEFTGHGHPELNLSNPISIVFRTSEFISDRTALIGCNKSSLDLNRQLITYLQNPDHSLTVLFYRGEPNLE
jgi:uncharacterized protein